MQRQFNRLKERVGILSNHHQKYIRTIEKYGELLIERLEEKGRIEKVHLWKYAYNLSDEMDIIADVAIDEKEKSIFLGCYYAFQILHLNLRSIDVLIWNLTRTDDKIPVYKNFMLDVGKEFRDLTSTYMRKIIDLNLRENQGVEFNIISVGSLAHQDDIDIGIIDDGQPQRSELNRVIGKLRNEMLKWAIEMHLYLSEHVGEENYSASIDEYRELLDQDVGDFVIISEMLMSFPILGSQRLYKEFIRKVNNRYYFHPNRENKYHEGYIRGIIGEVRSLLLRQMHENMINPKDDGLRMLMGLALAGRTVFRVYHGNRWDILAALRQRDPGRKELYKNLEDAITFLEVFRHIYQLFVAQEEEIYLDDPSVNEQMQSVARTLGYRDFGAITAWDHLLIHYHEKIQLAKDVAEKLLDDVAAHLRSISIFTTMVKGSWEPDQYRNYAGNLAVDFLKKSAFFKESKFWDDVLEALADKDGHVLENFIKDLRSLKPAFQDLIIQKYCQSAQRSFYSMIYFLVLLAKNKSRLKCEDLVIKFNDYFLEEAATIENRVVRLTKVFHQYPGLVNDYLMTLRTDDQIKFYHLLDGELWSKEETISKKTLENLCRLHFENSHYFRRFFVRVIENYPEYIQYLQDTAALEQIAKGFLGSVDNSPDFANKKKLLGNYYDVEFLRVGLETIQGAAIERINADFTDFSDTYLQTLFDICKKSVDEKSGETISTRDLFAIFVAGGHAREQAFDDDYDILMFLRDPDEQIKKYVTKIVVKMNAEIIKRGTMPHYRFTDTFGDYVTLIHDLDDYFSQSHEDLFIDKSQILGSRMIVGSTKFENYFEQRIIKPHIYDRCDEYIDQMIQEMKSRRLDKRNVQHGDRNIKETPGGLRDIEMVLLMYKAKYQLREPINKKLVEKICLINPNHQFCFLAEAFNFLKNLRDLYRLTISAEDVLNMEYLQRVALIMRYTDAHNGTAAEQLIEKYHQCTQQVTEAIDSLIIDLKSS